MHFLMLVLVRPDIPDIKDEVIRLMKPFSAEYEVEAYDAYCGCVEERASQQGFHVANEQVAPLPLLQKQFNELPAAERPLWHEFAAEWLEAKERGREEYLDDPEADPDCPDCDGRGLVKTTENDNAKWEWFQIGGRWDKRAVDYEKSRLFRERADVRPTWKRLLSPGPDPTLRNASYVDELETLGRGYAPAAIVTPDGNWHPEDELDVSELDGLENPDYAYGLPEIEAQWAPIAKAIVDKHKDHIAVWVDAHA